MSTMAFIHCTEPGKVAGLGRHSPAPVEAALTPFMLTVNMLAHNTSRPYTLYGVALEALVPISIFATHPPSITFDTSSSHVA